MAAYLLLPVALNLPFAIAGRPLMGGDNLVQNYPLRVLSGELIVHGRLPLWNPDIWSGAPLLAGWNAGAMFPGTWLFAALPHVAAWELNVIAVSVIAAIGIHVFLRRQGCSSMASMLAALSFTYAGFMSAQSVHFGLVMGMAFVPWLLVAIDAMARTQSFDELLLPTALFALSGGLVVLAGDPRAISNDTIVAAAYLVAVGWRSRTRDVNGAPRIGLVLAGVAIGAAIAVGLSAAQWLPGLAYLHQSQRATGRLSFFGFYSLSPRKLPYLVSPFLFGSNGTLGLPTTNFNLPEYTFFVGILPLVAFFAIGARSLVDFASRVVGGRVGFRKIAGNAPVGVYIALVVIGVLLSLGTSTPLGHLLVHIPLYGGERLQVRNMGVTDLALCALVAFFVDGLSNLARRVRAPQWPERVGGAIPPLVAVALVVVMLADTAGTEHFLGSSHLLLGLPDRMAPYYAFEVVVAAVAFIVATTRLFEPTRRRQLAAAVVVADVAMFVALASYQPAPTSSLATQNDAVAALVRASGDAAGRQAIFDPQQLAVANPPHVLDDLGVDDLVIVHGRESVQGYGSAVAGVYETATGAHEVENLRPSEFLASTFNVLNLRVLATLPEFFGTIRRSSNALAVPTGPPRPPGSSRSARQPGNAVVFARVVPAGPWRLSSGRSTTFELPAPVAIDRVAVRLSAARINTTTPLGVTVFLRSGARRSFALQIAGGEEAARVPSDWTISGGGVVDVAVAARNDHRATVSSSVIVEAIAVHDVKWASAVPLSSSVATPSQAWFQLDGILQGLVPPTAWRYESNDGAVVLYRNLKSDGPAWLEPKGSSTDSTSARAPGTVKEEPRSAWQDPVDNVSAPRGALLVRSETYSPGWSATVVSASEPSASMTRAVRQVGLVQGVELPPGRWIVTWHYRSKRTEIGLGVGAFALVGLGALIVASSWSKRRRRSLG